MSGAKDTKLDGKKLLKGISMKMFMGEITNCLVKQIHSPTAPNAARVGIIQYYEDLTTTKR